MTPLLDGVVQRFTQGALRQDPACNFEMSEEFLKVVVDSPCFEPTGFLSPQWSGPLIFESGFDAVDLPDLQEDPGNDFWMITFGFDELAADVCETADGDDVELWVTLDEGAVGSQAVALEVAGEGGVAFFADEDVVEAGVGPAFVPVEEDAVFGMMVGPEVALAGFPGARIEAANGCFIRLEVVAGAELGGDELVERLKSACKVVVPGAHEVAGEFDAVGGS